MQNAECKMQNDGSFFALLKKMTQMQENPCICGENMLQWKM
jgi:hypothetical protein